MWHPFLSYPYVTCAVDSASEKVAAGMFLGRVGGPGFQFQRPTVLTRFSSAPPDIYGTICYVRPLPAHYCMGGCPVCRPDSHPYTVKKYQCRTDTVSSPDDGHIVTRNMYRS